MKRRPAYRGSPLYRAGILCLGTVFLVQQLAWTTDAHPFGTTKLQKRLPRGTRLLHPSNRLLPQRKAIYPQRDLVDYDDKYPKYEDDYYYAYDGPVYDYDKRGKMGSSKKSKGHTYPTKPSDEETKVFISNESMKNSNGKGNMGASTSGGKMKSSGGKIGKDKYQKHYDYYYDDHYHDDYYEDDSQDDDHDSQTCAAVYTDTESCCVCQCCHNLGPSYPDTPSYPLAPGKGSIGTSKGHKMGKGKKEKHGRNLSGYPSDDLNSRCYCTCDEDCAVPTPPPQVVHTPPPYSTPTPQTTAPYTPAPHPPPSYPPPTAPPPKKSSGSKKEKGSTKDTTKKSKSTKSKSTKETIPRSSTGDEIEEKSGTGTDTAPPYESSYSRRNFKFPWLLLLIVGACGSLYTLHLLNRRRQLDNIDDTGTRMSWSV